MPAEKNLFVPAAMLTAAYFRCAGSEKVSTDEIMETFDAMYDTLDCYSREKNERESMSSMKEWLEAFYSRD